MAELMDFVTGVGSKRRITELAQETLLLQQPELSDSSFKSSSLVASSPQEAQETIQDIPSPKKVKSGEEKAGSCDLASGLEDSVKKIADFGDKLQETEDLPSGYSDSGRKIGDFGDKLQETEDLASGSFVSEENMEDCGKKVGTFAEKLQETEDSVMGFVSGSELNKKDVLGEADSVLEAKKKLLLAKFDLGFDESVRPSLKVEVIDDTVLIDTVPVLKNGNGCVKNAQRNGKKNEKQEADGKKAKRPRRKGKDGRKDLGSSDVVKKMPFVGNGFNGRNGNGEKNWSDKRKYTREEMEALRFVNIVEQRNLWSAVYAGLGDVVMKEYKDLACSRNQKNFQLNCDPSQRFGKKANIHGIHSKAGSGNSDEELETGDEHKVENMKLSDSSSCLGTGGEDGNSFVEEDCNDEYDSDEEYASIHRPAFHVEGEPNFDSGPPEDGLEFLRRVRWEATREPKFTLAKLDKNKLKEQSNYMPQFSEMDECPEHLLPLKQWEDAFLADFSELRKLLAYEDSSFEISSKMQSFSISHEQRNESIILEKFNNLGTNEVRSDELVDSSGPNNTCDQLANAEASNTRPSSADGSSSNYPRFSAILAMEPVARVSMLRKRISLAETASRLMKDDCLWLFALCAAVDIPVDADTCAALRSLLRKCTSLRAAKSEVDDEVIMLNILVTISAKYFKQSTWTELV
ncbi:spliceosome protein-related [Euphorbia peplus]|nr:spliceosome protein-related [Euphorbia peplus]